MKVPRSVLAELIGQKTLTTRNLKLLTKEIAAYLIQEGRTSELEPLMRDVLAYREENGIIEADVMSAHDLSEGTHNEVAELLRSRYKEAKKVVINNTVDPSVIGGLRVKLAHDQLDLSVRARLDTFKRLTTGGKI